MVNIAVFVSGNGSNCENIICHFADSKVARVTLVISNREDALALKRAERLGVDTKVITKTELADKTKMETVLDDYQIGFVVLAGFLLMIPDFLINRYHKRMVNIHPSLLPKYGGKGMYGHHVHEAVKAAGDTVTGITIHFVSNVCDGGDILLQATTKLSPDDTADDIAEKVHQLEMEHFPKVIEHTISLL